MPELSIELDETQEALLGAYARQFGMTVEEYAKNIIAGNLQGIAEQAIGDITEEECEWW